MGDDENDGVDEYDEIRLFLRRYFPKDTIDFRFSHTERERKKKTRERERESKVKFEVFETKM